MKVKAQEYSGFVYIHVEGRTGSGLTKFWDVEFPGFVVEPL